MEYNALFKIKSILDLEIQELIRVVAETDEQYNMYKTTKKNIQNLIRNNKYINAESLRLISHIIDRYKLDVEFDKDLYARVLGVYYIDPNEESKSSVEELLNPLLLSLEKRMNICEKNKGLYNNKLTIVKKLSESLNGLINYKEFSHIKAIGNDVLDSLLSYILRIPSNIMSDEEKTEALYEFNVLNVEALQSRESLINNNSGQTQTNYTEKPMTKIKFEYDYSSFFEDIEELVDIYKSMNSNIGEVEKNQMLSISKEYSIEILSQSKIDEIDKYIKDIRANFTTDYYIKYILLKTINDWYEIYQNSYDEEDWKSIFDEIQGAIDTYQDYIEREEEALVDDDDVSNNDLFFLQDNNEVIVGIDWMENDSHTYDSSDYRDLLNGFKKIARSSREKLLTGTRKVKGAGIPGVSEAKFRRLRLGTARILFIDLNNLIDDRFNKYVDGLNSCYVILNFGQKAGEFAIYKSLNIKESNRIPLLIEKFQAFINDSIDKIIKLEIPDSEKKKHIEEFIRNIMINNNELFKVYKEEFQSKVDSMHNTDGGLKND